MRTGSVESFYPSIFQLATGKTEQLAQFNESNAKAGAAELQMSAEETPEP